MKTKLALTLIALVLPFAARAEVGAWQKDYDALLKKYVSGDGVRYSAWKANAADMAALGKVVAAVAAENPSSYPRNEKLAFYINAYNASILSEALQKYPTKSVKDTLFTFFTAKRITVAGEQLLGLCRVGPRGSTPIPHDLGIGEDGEHR